MPNEPPEQATMTLVERGRSLTFPDAVVTVKDERGRTAEAPLGLDPLVVGSGAECHLVVDDPRISRRHCSLHLTKHGVVLRDLGSKNHTLIGDVPVMEALLPPHTRVTIGGSELTVKPRGAPIVVPVSPSSSFGGAVGQSLAMRALFSKLERAAASDHGILLLGESGTGKEVLAKAIHDHSPRREGPFVVLDCGAISPSLVEAELFGHARGAFTGAQSARVGLLEEAHRGTLFVDELGELPIDLQPKLLRALAEKKIRRIGETEWRPFDARIVAATHRDLRARIAEGKFREDLYYRLAVVEARLPALRERREDVPLLVEHFLKAYDPPRAPSDLPPHALAMLTAHTYPGNVRELRNIVARLVLFPELAHEMTASAPAKAPGAGGDERLKELLAMPLLPARELVVEEFERRYLAEKLDQHKGNISKAADAMRISRQLLHRLIDRYDLKAK